MEAQYMFNKVTAVKFYRHDISQKYLNAYLKRNLRSGMTVAEVQNVLSRVQ
ncbi:MAG: hypothetical protein PHO32_07240 [Candidatus Cloacimonetes bacterium]|nr:hypothetical protein [Candidatus Cloacimonadota bacterium]